MILCSLTEIENASWESSSADKSRCRRFNFKPSEDSFFFLEMILDLGITAVWIAKGNKNTLLIKFHCHICSSVSFQLQKRLTVPHSTQGNIHCAEYPLFAALASNTDSPIFPIEKFEYLLQLCVHRTTIHSPKGLLGIRRIEGKQAWRVSLLTSEERGERSQQNIAITKLCK